MRSSELTTSKGRSKENRYIKDHDALYTQIHCIQAMCDIMISLIYISQFPEFFTLICSLRVNSKSPYLFFFYKKVLVENLLFIQSQGNVMLIWAL